MDTSLLQNINASDIEKFKQIAEIFNKSTFSEAVTLRVFVDEYGNFIKENRSTAYYLSVRNSLTHLTEFFGMQRPIQSIGLRDIENFVSQLQKKVIRGHRVYIRTLKAAFNKAIDWNYVKENYFLKVKLPKKQKVNPVFLDSVQLSAISIQIKNSIVKDIVVFAFYTGMRLNEIMNLTWKNVDLEKRIITIGDENFTTKGRNQRYVPISNEVNDVLVKREKSKVKGKSPLIIPLNPLCPSDISPLKKGGEFSYAYVFCKNDGKKFTGDYVSKKFKQACKTTGVDNSIHFHSLRHSFASNLAQKGVSIYTIKELLGHASISTTEIYSHLNMDSLREAIGVFDASASFGTNKKFNN